MSELNKFIRVSLTDYKIGIAKMSVSDFWTRRLKAEGVEIRLLDTLQDSWIYKTRTGQSGSYLTPGRALLQAVKDLVVFVDAFGAFSTEPPEDYLGEQLLQSGKLKPDPVPSQVTPEIRDYIEERLSVLVEAYALGKQLVIAKTSSELAKDQGISSLPRRSKRIGPRSLQHLIEKLQNETVSGPAADCFDLQAAADILKWVTEPIDFISGEPHRPWPAPGTEVEFVVDGQHNDVRWSRGLKTGTRVKILANQGDLVIFSFTTRSGNLGYEGAQICCFRELSAVDQGTKP